MAAKGKILVVEDDPALVELLVFNFEREDFEVERISTDGDMKRFRELVAELDGKVDAFGVGGTDIYVVAGSNVQSVRRTSRQATIDADLGIRRRRRDLYFRSWPCRCAAPGAAPSRSRGRGVDRRFEV